MDTNRSEHRYNRYDTLFGSTGNYDLSNYSPAKPGIFKAPKMSAIITVLGVPTYIWAVFLNIGTWKGDLLLFLSVLFAFFKLVFFIARKLQDWQERRIEIKAKRKRYEQDIFE